MRTMLRNAAMLFLATMPAGCTMVKAKDVPSRIFGPEPLIAQVPAPPPAQQPPPWAADLTGVPIGTLEHFKQAN